MQQEANEEMVSAELVRQRVVMLKIWSQIFLHLGQLILLQLIVNMTDMTYDEARP